MICPPQNYVTKIRFYFNDANHKTTHAYAKKDTQCRGIANVLVLALMKFFALEKCCVKTCS
jgi:hypothetical protein